MSYTKCKRCGEYGWDSHSCPPVWMVWEGEGGMLEEDASEVYATDHQKAAEKYMQMGYMGGYYESEVITADVTDGFGGNRKKFTVTREWVPEFTATEKEEIKSGSEKSE